jgi:hypothetical protein
MSETNEPEEGQESAATPESGGSPPESADAGAASAPVSPEPEAATPPARAPETAPDEAAKAAEPVVDRARRDVQADKRAADKGRHDAALVAPPTPTEADLAEEKRKAGIREKLVAVQNTLEEALATIDGCKEEARALMADLYPSLVKSDRPVDAVKGYVESQKALRKNRALEPARLKALLQAAGKAPIDAAFHRQRARGMARPIRSAVKPEASAAPDHAKGAVPDAAAAGQE